VSIKKADRANWTVTRQTRQKVSQTSEPNSEKYKSIERRRLLSPLDDRLPSGYLGSCECFAPSEAAGALY